MNDHLNERTAAVTVGQSHILLYQDWADKYARFAHREAELNAELPTLELALVNALVGTPKPGEEKAEKPKVHSVSSAEEQIKTDPRLLDHKRMTRDVVLQKDHAFTQMTAARLNVELATAQIHSYAVVLEVPA